MTVEECVAQFNKVKELGMNRLKEQAFDKDNIDAESLALIKMVAQLSLDEFREYTKRTTLQAEEIIRSVQDSFKNLFADLKL